MKEPKIAPTDERGFLLNWPKELKKSYRATYWALRKSIKRNTVFIHGVEQEHPDKQIIKGIISDLHYAITWMHISGRPNRKHGVEHKRAYQKKLSADSSNRAIVKYFDEKDKESFYKDTSVRVLTSQEKFMIEDALSRLSPRERECYELRHASMYKIVDIAELLDISAGSVEVYLNRAQQKVSEDLGSSLFLQI